MRMDFGATHHITNAMVEVIHLIIGVGVREEKVVKRK